MPATSLCVLAWLTPAGGCTHAYKVSNAQSWQVSQFWKAFSRPVKGFSSWNFQVWKDLWPTFSWLRYFCGYANMRNSVKLPSLGKGNEQQARSQLAWKVGGTGMVIRRFQSLFSPVFWTVLAESVALRKDLLIGIMNRRCRKFASLFFEKILCSKVLDFPRSDNGMNVCVFYRRCCSTFFFVFRKFTENPNCTKAKF